MRAWRYQAMDLNDPQEIVRDFQGTPPEVVTEGRRSFVLEGPLFGMPELAPVRGTRRGNDGHFTSHALPLDPGNTHGVYPRVDEVGRPRFASIDEVKKTETALRRRGMDVAYDRNHLDELADNQEPVAPGQMTQKRDAWEAREIKTL
jgi:hypothetical protein